MTPTTAARGGSLREFTEAECWRHLSEHETGRIGFVDGDGPVILPLNYLARDDRIWWRTASYDQLAIHLPGQRAAFQIDHVDERDHSGWSVLVRGRAEHVLDHQQSPWGDSPGAAPWPSGTRTMGFCLAVSEITGRALCGREVSPPSGHGPGTIQRSGPRDG